MHPVRPQVRLLLTLTSNAALKPHRLRRVHPDAVGQAADSVAPRAGDPFEDDERAPWRGLPAVQGGTELVAFPVSDLVMRVLAVEQGRQHLGIETRPPAGD